MPIVEISKNEFDAICYARNAQLTPIFREVSYYKDEDASLYGLISFDITDGDFAGLVLGRDATKRFRAVSIPKKFYNTQEQAYEDLVRQFEEVAKEGELHPQGDEIGKPNELYHIKAKSDRINSLFKKLLEDPLYSPAKEFIGEAVYSYVDVDGNYIKDFQSTGFNSRLWELYLYIFLKQQGFYIDNSFQAPDYFIKKWGVKIAIEATTVNSNIEFDETLPLTENEIFCLINDYMPIKFGSSLNSKLKNEYWKKDHIKDIPLVFAIHDFHMGQALLWSGGCLRDYLYGLRYRKKMEDGIIKQVLNPESHTPFLDKITAHSFKHKVNIPSNFFAQPGAENISAVLYCNNSTLDTFNRYGKLAKMGQHANPIQRVSNITDLNSNNYSTKVIREVVGHSDYEERWTDTMVMYHNPTAKCSLDYRLFPDITHCFCIDEVFCGPKIKPEILAHYNEYK